MFIFLYISTSTFQSFSLQLLKRGNQKRGFLCACLCSSLPACCHPCTESSASTVVSLLYFCRLHALVGNHNLLRKLLVNFLCICATFNFFQTLFHLRRVKPDGFTVQLVGMCWHKNEGRAQIIFSHSRTIRAAQEYSTLCM